MIMRPRALATAALQITLFLVSKVRFKRSVVEMLDSFMFIALNWTI